MSQRGYGRLHRQTGPPGGCPDGFGTLGPDIGSGAAAGAKVPVAAASPAPPAATATAPQDEPPVEMDRLKDLTDGNEDNLRELVKFYVQQTTEQLEQLKSAVRGNRTDEVRRVAHSCAGASATCGMPNMVPLRELERQGHEGKLTTAGN